MTRRLDDCSCFQSDKTERDADTVWWMEAREYLNGRTQLNSQANTLFSRIAVKENKQTHGALHSEQSMLPLIICWLCLLSTLSGNTRLRPWAALSFA